VRKYRLTSEIGKNSRSRYKMKHTKILFILILISLALLASGCEEKLSAEEIATKMQEKEASL